MWCVQFANTPFVAANKLNEYDVNVSRESDSELNANIFIDRFDGRSCEMV